MSTARTHTRHPPHSHSHLHRALAHHIEPSAAPPPHQHSLPHQHSVPHPTPMPIHKHVVAMGETGANLKPTIPTSNASITPSPTTTTTATSPLPPSAKQLTGPKPCNGNAKTNGVVSVSGDADTGTIIAPRSFNRLTFCGEKVTKASSSSAIDGELYFYRTVPEALRHLFPTLLSFTVAPEPVTLTIARVRGLTLSTLLTSGHMTRAHITAALTALHELHSFGVHPQTPLMYANHATKVARRQCAPGAAAVYRDAGLPPAHFAALQCILRGYEAERRGLPVSVIHGDPVLTNIIACDRVQGTEGKTEAGDTTDIELKLIDMRGAQGEHLTLAGDAVYDLAKLLQSLLGYDFLLADKALPAAQTLAPLLDAFWATTEKLYPKTGRRDVAAVCCGLLTSLIPLHDNVAHRRGFATMARTLLEMVMTEDGLGDGAGDVVCKFERALRDLAEEE